MKFATLLTVVLEELSFKKNHFFLKFDVAMATKQNGHKTLKLGRQSSNDHNCLIWFTSLRITG